MESPNISAAVIRIDERENLFPHFLIFTILTYTITACIIFVNGSILLAFVIQKIRRPSLARLSPAGVLVLNLLFADAFVGAVTIIMTATETRNMAATRWRCAARLAVSYLALIGSHVALINVVIDRYVAIMHTLHYRDWVTMQRSLTMILFGWLVPIVGSVVALLTDDWQPGLITCEQIDSFRQFLSYIWVPSHVLALLCVIVIQGRVYLQLRRYEVTSKAQTASSVLKHYSKKSVQVLCRVTTTFVVCWGPFDVVLLIIIFWPMPVLKVIYDTSAIIAHFSFLVNPCIYSMKTENIRKPVSALCSDIKGVFCKKAETETKQSGGADAGAAPPSGLHKVAATTLSGTSPTQSTSLDGHGDVRFSPP